MTARAWTVPGRRSLAAAALLAGAFLVTPAAAMTYRLAELPSSTCASNCPLVIVADGEIGLNSAEEFFAFVKSQVLGRNVASTVLIASPGGNVVGSLKLGGMMRSLGFSLLVGQVSRGEFLTARCYSACAYTLAGGKRRIVPEGSQVGVHAAWTRTTSMRDIVGSGGIDPQVPRGRVSEVLGRYLSQMGVSPQLVALAETTPSSEIRILSRQELSSLRLANGTLGGEQRRRKRSR